MKLRDYQQAAVDAVYECWKRCKSCLVVLPTGCGKTVVFGAIIKRLLLERPDARAMILAHRAELIHQAVDKVGKITTAYTAAEMGAIEADPILGKAPSVVVSTVQTQCTGRMEKFAPSDFSALVIDEAHHATSRTYRQCIDHYLANPECRLLGVTATPDRADETALGNVFDEVAYSYSLADAVQGGWLVPVREKIVHVSDLDFSKVTTTAGDLNQAELAEILEEEKNLHAFASPTIELCGNRRAIIFTVTVAQAEHLCEILNRHFPKEDKHAEWICGKTNKADRENILETFKAGKLQYLVNVGVLTEGFDDAGVEVVVMARPTKSRALYAQMAGRATRPAAEIAAKLGEVTGDDAAAERRKLIANSKKPGCLIIDFVGNAGRHKLVSTLDILGGNDIDYDEEALELARKKCAEENEKDAAEALREACKEVAERKAEEERKRREELLRQQEAERLRRRMIAIRAKFTTISVNPFDIYDLPQYTSADTSTAPRPMLREWERNVLRTTYGIDPDKESAATCRSLMDEHNRRNRRRGVTLRQQRILAKRGFPMPMDRDEASRTITRISSKEGWNRSNNSGRFFGRRYR